MGSTVLLSVIVIPIIFYLFVLLNYRFYFSLWLKHWLLFPVDDQVKYLEDIVD